MCVVPEYPARQLVTVITHVVGITLDAVLLFCIIINKKEKIIIVSFWVADREFHSKLHAAYYTLIAFVITQKVIMS